MEIIKYYYKTKSVIELSFVLAKAEFKLKNEGSYIGVFWYLLNPILMFGLLLFVFNDRLGGSISYYPLYLLLGIIMFNFFQNATLESVVSILRENRGIIKTINFSRESLVASIIFKNLFSHFFEILLFLFLAAYFGISLVNMFYYFIILFFFCLFVLGVSLILASLTVYFVDLENVWMFAVRLLWIGTPIFYAIAGQTRLYYINLLNPMYYFLTTAREIVIFSKFPDTLIISGTIFYTALFFVVGILVFNMLKTKFAEKI